MTLTTIFQSVLGSPSAGHDNPTSSQAHGYFSEKNSGAAEYYHYGSYNKSKGKSKSDKKHAVLSALTLLAFLFFLNILQNCIREQSQNRGTMMMFLPTAPTGQQSKEPEPGQPTQQKENRFGKKRSFEQQEQREKRPQSEVVGRKTRNLLGIPTSGESPVNTRREVKFIRNFNKINNWTRELSQVSEKDLEDQKLKTINFPLYWKNNRLAPSETKQPSMSPSRAIPTPTFSASKIEKSPPALKKITKRERTTIVSRVVFRENETGSSSNDTAPKKIRDHGNSIGRKPEGFLGSKRIFEKGNKDFGHGRRQSFQPDSAWKGFNKAPVGLRNDPQLLQETSTSTGPTTPKNTAIAQNALSDSDREATTPRKKRSDYSSTPGPEEYDEYDGPDDPVRQRVRPLPTPAVGLNLNTFQTFPVYNYYNHRNNAHLYGENEAPTIVASEVTGVDRIRAEAPMTTTEPPFFDPAKTSPSNLGPPFFEFGNKYYDHRGRYPYRNHYSAEHRYKHSPYRKATADEGLGFRDPLRDDYRVVLADYPANKESGFDLVNFFRSLFSSFAKPLTKLVPSFAKEDRREPQCFDLLVCEARRVSRFMGPTAEALTATLGSLLTWAATGETRRSVADALSAGMENTCQQQIRECEGKSGGKSAMTVIARLMEMKLR